MQKIVLFVLFGAIVTTFYGCTRAVMSIAGIDPDTINIEPLKCYGVKDFQPILDNTEPLRGELRQKVIYIAPTDTQISEHTSTSPSTEKLALLYQETVYDRLGSMRSIEEMRSKIIPGLTCSNRFAYQEFMHRIIRKRGIFGEIEVQRNQTINSIKNINSNNIIYIDFEKIKNPDIVLIRNGEKVRANINDMFPSRDPNSFNHFLSWVEGFYR